MKPPFSLILLAPLVALAASALAQDNSIGLTPDQVKWGDVRGLGQAMVLHGDPSKADAYVVRIKIGPNNVTMPHTHPQAESITVISGWIGFGLGPVFDKAKGRVLSAGSFFHLPADTPHFAWTGPDGAVIQAHGIGPFP